MEGNLSSEITIYLIKRVAESGVIALMSGAMAKTRKATSFETALSLFCTVTAFNPMSLISDAGTSASRDEDEMNFVASDV